jgi:PTS system nitrogen regulatory IIA component
MPHAPVDGLDAALVLFVRLARPIDWEAIDDEPVDLVLAVLSPTRVAGASMNVLSKFARLLRSDAVRARLRVGDAAEVAAELAAA